MSREKQRQRLLQDAEPISKLIDYARERDELGRSKVTREQLIEALMVLGRGRKEAERVVENARVRVRKAADKAEQRLQFLLADEKPWQWTGPREAIREMRIRSFGAFSSFELHPLTDIEQGLLEKGNVLWIIAVYPALQWAILSRLQLAGGAGAPDASDEAPEAPNNSGTSPGETSPTSP